MADRQRIHRGLTLLELVVVVAILVVLAGIALPTFNSFQDEASESATHSSLLAIRDAIIGSGTLPGGYEHDAGELPETMADLFYRPDDLANTTTNGWYGPYLRDATGRYRVDPTRGFSAEYGAEKDPAVLDVWGHPIVLQRPSESTENSESECSGDSDMFARLVSAGPDGHIDTSPDLLYPLPPDPDNADPVVAAGQRGDDLVVFLKRPDIPCSPLLAP